MALQLDLQRAGLRALGVGLVALFATGATSPSRADDAMAANAQDTFAPGIDAASRPPATFFRINDVLAKLDAMRGRLSARQLHAARTEGRALAPDAALREAEETVRLLAHAAQPPSDPEPMLPGAALTRREQDVARLLGAGYSDRQIAAALGIALGTTAVHVHHVLRKLGVRSRSQVGDQGSASQSTRPIIVA